LRPSEVEIEIGWDGTQGDPADHLYTLLQLRAARMPFTVITGKQTMPNMLIANISTVTDQRTNSSIIAIVRCRQINLVSTQSTTIAPIASNQSDQAAPAATTPSTSGGTATLQPTSWGGAAGIPGLPGSPSGPSVTPPAGGG
jgi:hypothetical protein